MGNKDLKYIEKLLKENKELKEQLNNHRTKDDIIKKIKFLLKIKDDLNLYRLNFENLALIENSISLLKYSQTND